MTILLPALSLWRREMVRFFRQPNRVVGAVGSPLLFWVLIGSGVGRSFRPEGSADDLSYLEYIFPGTILMILLFTAIFSTISIIEDRKEGFLQSVLVSPVPRGVVVLGKILGGTSLAFVQALVLVALAPVAGIPLHLPGLLPAIGLLWVLGMGLTGLGFVIAWRMSSTQGFHAIMNLVLLPMWLLSGALFPPGGSAVWMRWVMYLNPLTYGLDALRRLLSPNAAAGAPTSLTISILITILFTVVTFAAASWVARGHTREDLQ